MYFSDRERLALCDPFIYLPSVQKYCAWLFALPISLLGECIFFPITTSLICFFSSGKCKFDAAFTEGQHPHAFSPW